MDINPYMSERELYRKQLILHCIYRARNNSHFRFSGLSIDAHHSSDFLVQGKIYCETSGQFKPLNQYVSAIYKENAASDTLKASQLDLDDLFKMYCETKAKLKDKWCADTSEFTVITNVGLDQDLHKFCIPSTNDDSDLLFFSKNCPVRKAKLRKTSDLLRDFEQKTLREIAENERDDVEEKHKKQANLELFLNNFHILANYTVDRLADAEFKAISEKMDKLLSHQISPSYQFHTADDVQQLFDEIADKFELKKYLESIYHNERIKIGQISADSMECAFSDTVKLDLMKPADVESIAETLPLVPSPPFGLNSKTVVYTYVRDSSEWRLNQTTNTVPQVIRNIGQIVVARELDCSKYFAVPYKLIVYKEGGFFNEHTDTPEENLTHSLVVVLPTAHTGGDLMFNEFNSGDKFCASHLNFVLFDPFLPHYVSKVVRGVRVCITYKIFKMASLTYKSVFNYYQPKYVERGKNRFPFSRKLKNVLLVFEDIDGLQSIIEKLDPKIQYATVYSTNKLPSLVYTSYKHPDSLSPPCYYGPFDEEDCFKDRNAFEVSDILCVGSACCEHTSLEYTRHFGCKGNDEPFSQDEELRLNKFLLVNPYTADDLEESEREEIVEVNDTEDVKAAGEDVVKVVEAEDDGDGEDEDEDEDDTVPDGSANDENTDAGNGIGDEKHDKPTNIEAAETDADDIEINDPPLCTQTDIEEIAGMIENESKPNLKRQAMTCTEPGEKELQEIPSSQATKKIKL